MGTQDVIREHVMVGLHVARLAPGDRVPSVRRMAQLTGLDRKAIHRAYLRLAAEGLLVTRPGSGTYVAPAGPEGTPDAAQLLSASERFADEAGAIGLDPGTYARFLGRMAERRAGGVRLAVVECNLEQLGLIAAEVADALGVVTTQVLLADVRAALRAGSIPSDPLSAIVTTECHREEVTRHAAPHGVPVYRVALDPEHAETVLRHAARGRVVMVVRDLRYEGALRRLFAQLRVPRELDARVTVVERQGLERAFHALDPPVVLHVSPLAGPAPAQALPPGWRRVSPHRYTDESSLGLLRAQLALLEARGGDGARAATKPSRAPLRAAGPNSY